MAEQAEENRVKAYQEWARAADFKSSMEKAVIDNDASRTDNGWKTGLTLLGNVFSMTKSSSRFVKPLQDFLGFFHGAWRSGQVTSALEEKKNSALQNYYNTVKKYPEFDKDTAKMLGIDVKSDTANPPAPTFGEKLGNLWRKATGQTADAPSSEMSLRNDWNGPKEGQNNNRPAPAAATTGPALEVA